MQWENEADLEEAPLDSPVSYLAWGMRKGDYEFQDQVNAILARYRAYMRLVPREPPEREEPPPAAPLAVMPEVWSRTASRNTCWETEVMVVTGSRLRWTLWRAGVTWRYVAPARAERYIAASFCE